MKAGIAILLLAGLTPGCVKSPLPEKAAWPWEYEGARGRHESEYFVVRGNVATFGEPPKAVKPVSREALDPKSSTPPAPAPKTANVRMPTSTDDRSGSGAPENRGTGNTREATGEYDFTIEQVKVVPPVHLQITPAVFPAYDITAFNRGNAPVSVTLGIDPTAPQKTSIDKRLPLTVVVPPHSDLALVRITPKKSYDSYNLSHPYSWSIGNHTAIHDCAENYRFPFEDAVQAFAMGTDNADSRPYARHAVIFSMPTGTPVLAARKGTVVRIRTSKVDILHDDLTVGTYSHLETTSAGLTPGTTVTPDDVIGVVGTAPDQREGYMQLTVWRPEPPPVPPGELGSPRIDFDYVSFPMKFCNRDARECRVITENQPIHRKLVSESRKQRERTSNSKR